MKFSNIRLLVDDFDNAFTFYKDILGLECTWGKLGDNFASFNIGITSGLALFRAGLMQQVSGGSTRAGSAGVSTDKMAIVIEVEDVTATYWSLKKNGVNFINQPADMAAWGIRVVHFRDPEDNLIELFSDMPKDQWAGHLIEQEKEFSSKK